MKSLEKDIIDINLWLGLNNIDNENGTTSRLHMDATDNVYVLIQGKKKFTLVSPNDSLKMKTISPTYQVLPNGHGLQYKTPNNNSFLPHVLQSQYEILDQSNYHFSTINTVDNKSLEYRSITFDINAGDILYLPTGWYHQVTSYGNTTAINYWFKPPMWEETLKSEIQALQKIYDSKLISQINTEL
jgi:ribosomal protein L16 Arg81 hydroxylase